MKRYLVLALVAALPVGLAACSGKPTDTGTPPVAAVPASAPAAAPPAGATAQSDDKAYCDKLGALALRFVRSAGGDGGSAPDLNVLGAITDCNRGRYDRAIPFLERRLRGVGVTLPPR
ncbi:hypothetical protein [Reyranella sp.]|uniref:hypothetical protein n=1 Tax=Reyranella sp. TaxID=1929291 RepID=UPI003D10D5C0